MYEYFEGTITVVNPAYVVIEVAGIGYRILTPTPYAYKDGDKARIYVEQVVRENGMTLYGFKSQQDKVLFNKLNEVSGIGPKSALAIMAAEDNGALASAIESGEVSYLTRFPGIGKKTASQIVLDLRGKMATMWRKTSLPKMNRLSLFSQPWKTPSWPLGLWATVKRKLTGSSRN